MHYPHYHCIVYFEYLSNQLRQLWNWEKGGNELSSEKVLPRK